MTTPTSPKTARERFVEAMRVSAARLNRPGYECSGYAACENTYEAIVAACDAFADESCGLLLDSDGDLTVYFINAEQEHNETVHAACRASLHREVFDERS